MKTIMKILVMGLVLGSLNLKAEEILDQDKQEERQTFVMMCGTVEQVEQELNQGQKLSESDMSELTESRKSLIDVLKNGNRAIQRLLDQGSKADTGPFGAVMVCGMLNIIKAEIKSEGCFDLVQSKLLKKGPGIAACEKVLAKLPR